MYMKDHIEQLDTILMSGGRMLLKHAGSITKEKALKKAESEYDKFLQKSLSPVEEAYIKTITDLEKKAKKQVRSKK